MGCMFACALRLYPPTPGWGVRCGCVCLESGFGCAPPLLAGVLGPVCVCVRAPLVPRDSWLCVRCGYVWLGSGFGCAPPLLAGVLGPLCACVAAPLVPRHSWLGCAVRVCVLGLGFWLCPATRGWGVGACVCLCARSACTPPLLAGVCGVGVCAPARVSAAPRHSWPGCWGVCVLVCALRLYPATPGWGVRCGCVCLRSGFGCASPLLAGVLGCVCACVRAPLVPRHSWLGCAVWVCVLVLGFRLCPATPGRGVGMCMCLCARSACTPPLLARCAVWCVGLGSGFGCVSPLLAGVLGCVCACVRAPLVPRHSWLGCAAWVRVCDWASVSAAPRHSWPGFWGVCVLLCALRLYPATPGWGVRCGCVCLGSGFCCAPALLPGVLGCVCASVRAPLVPRHSWLGGAMSVRLLGLRVSAAPRLFWLGCWCVCVLVCALRLYPATPGWGLQLGCLCLGSGFGCALPLLAWVLGCVCAW